jgi:hypothetical protein
MMKWMGLIVILLLCACAKKNRFPPGILDPEKMQAVYWDVLRANAFSSDFLKTDSSRTQALANAELQKKVFSLHGVGRVDFYNSLNYYKSNPALMTTILDSMIRKANRERLNLELKPVQPAIAVEK